MKKEKRSWFFSQTSVGQDQAFNKNRSGADGFRMFKNGNDPDEEVFRKQAESSVYKLDAEDRAKPTGENTQANSAGVEFVMGGHVTIATDAEAKAQDNGVEALYTRTVRPSQLPEVDEGSEKTFEIFGEAAFSDTVTEVFIFPDQPKRNKFIVTITEAFREFIESKLDFLFRKKLPLGAIVLHYGFELPEEYLPCNGGTLGKLGSGADYEGDKYFTLYRNLFKIETAYNDAEILQLWNDSQFAVLPTITGLTIGSNVASYIIRY